MRLWHLMTAVAVVSVVIFLARDPLTRVFMIMFATGLGEIVVGTASILALFQTIGAIGEARGIYAHAEAIAATSVVLAVATALMSGWLFVGAWVVSVTV